MIRLTFSWAIWRVLGSSTGYGVCCSQKWHPSRCWQGPTPRNTHAPTTTTPKESVFKQWKNASLNFHKHVFPEMFENVDSSWEVYLCVLCVFWGGGDSQKSLQWLKPWLTLVKAFMTLREARLNIDKSCCLELIKLHAAWSEWHRVGAFSWACTKILFHSEALHQSLWPIAN